MQHHSCDDQQVTPCGDSANNQQGLDAMEFPDGLSSAAVMLDWNNLEFKGGFVGVERLNNCVLPAVGRIKTHIASKHVQSTRLLRLVSL